MKTHVYIHIPFCEKKCPYCAFGSSDDEFKLIGAYFDALKSEILASNLPKIDTLFIGGGTPSVVGVKFYEEFFSLLKFSQNAEITSEANPNSASKIWLENMRNLGLNRISFGAQSFNEKKLKFLGRIHGQKEIFKAVENAKNVGFDNINLDLIYGTKFDTKKNLEFECENLRNLPINHISAYALTLENNTPFFDKKTYQNTSVKNAKFMIESIKNLGFKQYEISNFGKICEHNLSYWKGENYHGFGAFAVGFDGACRKMGAKSINEYIKNPFAKNIENLSQEDLHLERLFLGLRSIVGVDKSELSSKELEKAQILVSANKLRFEKSRFFNNDYLLSDEIALYLSQI